MKNFDVESSVLQTVASVCQRSHKFSPETPFQRLFSLLSFRTASFSDIIICFPAQSSELQLLVYPDPRRACMCQYFLMCHCFLLSHQFSCLVKFHRNKCESLPVTDIVVCLHLGGCSISDLVKSIK